MRHQVPVMLALALVAGCAKSPEERIADAAAQNATTAAKAAAEAKPIPEERRLRPGQWDVSIDVRSIEIPGVPPAATEQARANMSAMMQRGEGYCLTPEEAAKPTGRIFAERNDGECTYEKFAMTGGRMDAVLLCQRNGGTTRTEMSGSYTDEAYDFEARSTIKRPDMPGGSMTVSIAAAGKRVGDCASAGGATAGGATKSGT